jgi:hypothetical protein
MSAKMLDCSHRHVVFTIPEELRKYFALYRSLLDLLFKGVTDTIFFTLASKIGLKTTSPA